jgi:hypothetical protein
LPQVAASEAIRNFKARRLRALENNVLRQPAPDSHAAACRELDAPQNLPPAHRRPDGQVDADD